MIDCLIVDDEKDSIDLLTYYAKQVPNINVIKATTEPLEALALINERKVQLAFCDIQMPLVSGLDLAKAAMGKCKLIFVTAYSEFALQGYEHEVLDYLLKPVTFLRFMTAFQKAERLFAAFRFAFLLFQWNTTTITFLFCYFFLLISTCGCG